MNIQKIFIYVGVLVCINLVLLLYPLGMTAIGKEGEVDRRCPIPLTVRPS
jgi:hypothetical protein